MLQPIHCQMVAMETDCEQVAKRGRGWGVVDATRAISLQGSRAASWSKRNLPWKRPIETIYGLLLRLVFLSLKPVSQSVIQ